MTLSFSFYLLYLLNFIYLHIYFSYDPCDGNWIDLSMYPVKYDAVLLCGETLDRLKLGKGIGITSLRFQEKGFERYLFILNHFCYYFTFLSYPIYISIFFY